jgi:hypothetical protein
MRNYIISLFISILLAGTTISAEAQLSGLLGGKDKKNPIGNLLGGGDGDDKAGAGNGLGALLDGLGGKNTPGKSSSSGALGTIGNIFESAKNTNLGPVGRYVLGRDLAARMLGNYKVSKSDDIRVTYLQNLVANLLIASRLGSNFKDPTVVLLDSEIINAFAAPGGFVFVSTGMLDFVENEDELAFVLAHEISHIEMDHGLNAIKQNEGSKLFQSATEGMGAGGLFDDLLAFGENGFGKDLEAEADIRGAQIASSLGYDWKAGVSVIQRLDSITSRKHATGYPKDRAANLKKGSNAYSVNADNMIARTARFNKVMNR